MHRPFTALSPALPPTRGPQDEGAKGLAEILEKFDEPGSSPLRVGDTVEVKRNGKWGHFGRIVHHDTSESARPQFKDTYDIHFGRMLKFELADGSTVTRRDHDFDIGVRRKDIRVPDETGGVLFIDDAHQLEPGSDKAARQVCRPHRQSNLARTPGPRGSSACHVAPLVGLLIMRTPHPDSLPAGGRDGQARRHPGRRDGRLREARV